MTTLRGWFFNHGQPVDDYLAMALVELVRTGHLALGSAILSGQQQVCVTHVGQVRYTELNSSGIGQGRHGSR
ncbi:MAG: hypothetical protein ACRDTG_01050 [Pseudonocardiaceae bacterium]